MGKFDTYTVSDEDAAAHSGRLGAGDEYPFLPVTRDEDGVVAGYVFTPSGIHYVTHPESGADDDADAEAARLEAADDTAPAAPADELAGQPGTAPAAAAFTDAGKTNPAASSGAATSEGTKTK